MPKPSLRAWLAVAMLALAQFPSPAAGADPAQPRVIRLEPRQLEGLPHGRAVVVKGRAGPEGHRFMVDKLSYMMPVSVVLRPVEAGDEVALSITKYAWNQPLRQGSTDGELLRFPFRTEGEFQLAVSAKRAGTPYRLLVWVGEETKPEFAPVLVKASEYRETGGAATGLGSPVLWVIAAALVAAVVLLAILVLRRRPS